MTPSPESSTGRGCSSSFGVVYAVVQYPSGAYSDTLSRALLADLFAGTRGRALGLSSSGTDLGGLLAAGLAVAALATTWRAAFVPVVAALALVAALFVLWNREPYAIGRTALSPGATARRIAATPTQREALVAEYADYDLAFWLLAGMLIVSALVLARQHWL